MWPVRHATALLAMAAMLAACSKDVVLADDAVMAVCGDGEVESGEQCDIASPGCVACQIAPNWTCDASGCSQACGDGVIASGPTCEHPRRDTDCDMSGYWAVRATDYERDAIVGSVQVSSNWFLLRLEQSGDDFHVTESLDCGVHVSGSATVDYSAATLRALLYASRMDAAPHGPLHGSSRRDGAGCAVSFDRWYTVRGADESFLPTDFGTKPSLASLPPLPSVHDPVNGNEDPPGAIDQDGDGIPGVAFAVTGFVAGTRNAAQRDWKEYATVSGSPVAAGAMNVVVPGGFDLEDNVLRVTNCGSACALLASRAHAAQDIPARITLSFIGKSPGGARVSQVVLGPPRADLDTDLTSCARVRLVLPHDPSIP